MFWPSLYAIWKTSITVHNNCKPTPPHFLFVLDNMQYTVLGCHSIGLINRGQRYRINVDSTDIWYVQVTVQIITYILLWPSMLFSKSFPLCKYNFCELFQMATVNLESSTKNDWLARVWHVLLWNIQIGCNYIANFTVRTLRFTFPP